MVEGKNKTGFTLIELLVYMAILGIIVLVVGQVFKDSTKIRVRTQSMLKATEIAGAAASVLKTDVAQMGAKSSQEDVETFEVHNEVYIDPDNTDADLVDKSSFVLERSTAGAKHADMIAFKKIRYSEDGGFIAVDSVAWYIKDGDLIRSCHELTRKSGASANEDCPADGLTVIVAENADEFSVTPAKPGALDDGSGHLLFPDPYGDTTKFKLVPRNDGATYLGATVDPVAGGTSVGIKGLATNYDPDIAGTKDPYEDNCSTRGGCLVNELYAAEAGGDTDDWSAQCVQFTLQPGVEYQISFALPRNDEYNKAQTFVPGKDHLSIGFRDAETGTKVAGVNDFIFYPPTGEKASNIKRYMRFNVKEKIEGACLALSVVSFSPLVSTGTISISALKLRQLSEPNYDFSDAGYNPTIKDKAHIRAFKFDVKIKKNGEVGNVSQIVPVPSNGYSDK